MGKCKAALDLLSREQKGGTLHLDDLVNSDDPFSPTVRDSLVHKHPVGQPVYNSCIVPEEPQDPHPVIFESLDASAIHTAALRVNGAAGPSGLDSHAWRRLCTSYKGALRDLCAALASVAVRICTSYVHPSSIAPLLACRLIALDKHPVSQYILSPVYFIRGILYTIRRIVYP